MSFTHTFSHPQPAPVSNPAWLSSSLSSSSSNKCSLSTSPSNHHPLRLCLLFIAHIRVALIFVKTPSLMCYVLSASFMPQLTYSTSTHAFMQFTAQYCDRIAPPYPYPFVCNYAYSLLMTLFILVALDCLKVQELSFS